MPIGEKIKFLRKQLGITQEELAIAIGTKKQTIYKYEMGIISNIPASKIKDIAEKLGTTPAYLMGWEDHVGSSKGSKLYDNILALCEDKGIDIVQMCNKTGIDFGKLYDLKKGQREGLSSKTADKIAHYFGIPVSQLLDTSKDPFAHKPREYENTLEFLLDVLHEQNKTKGTAFFCGADGKVVDVPPEAESLILNLIETLDKNKK